MPISEISDQKLDTHPELGWARGETDMAKQRANWLRSMGLVEKHGDEYALTAEGRQFVQDAVEEWADTAWTPATEQELTAGTYETTVHARVVDPEFHATVLSAVEPVVPVRHGLLGVVTGVNWFQLTQRHPELSVHPFDGHELLAERGLR